MLKLRSWGSGTKRSLAIVIGIGGLLLTTQPVVLTDSAGPLSFAKSYLLTGNYVVGSVELASRSASEGYVSGPVPVSGVPANADVVAAFLYWETVSRAGEGPFAPKFRGQPITVVKATSMPLTRASHPCWCSEDGPQGRKMTAYRADVLRLLPQKRDANNPMGRYLVNDADLLDAGLPLHTVALPAGSGAYHERTPITPGASLVVVYRDRSQPLTSIVLYDGLYVQPSAGTMTQTIRGFLQSSSAHTAKITHIVGSGGPNLTERLYVNNSLLAVNPFRDRFGDFDLHDWAGVTYDVTSKLPGTDRNYGYGEEITTKLDHALPFPKDCLSWAAIVFSTTVMDSDADGLPDKLEDQSAMKLPDDTPLPDLHAMGASSRRKDVFIEAGALQADPGTHYGTGETDAIGHSHLPKPEVLKLVGDAYRNAPVPNLDGSSGIAVHFDVGPNYHGLGSGYESTEADAYLVPAFAARGGELVKEVDCAVSNPGCQFAGYPGTVSWKIGYQLLRDAPVGPGGEELPGAAMDACDVSGNCRRRFDSERMNFFHYILYAHSRAKPKEPCITGTEAEQALCRATNPNFKVPSTASGIGDLPGADKMVTLGGWGHGFTGSVFVQASTTLHEMGHSHWLTHGGSSVTVTEPNCKPNYLSIMNYLFQLGGLRDEDGTAHLDYSSSANGVLNETMLGGDPLNPIHLQYRTAWFAPLKPGTLPFALGAPAATKFCNGAAFPNPLPADWVPMARVDAYSATLQSIDWSAGLNAGLPQDVNFDGQLETALAGSNDWESLRLDQIGSRRNMGGFSLGVDLAFGVDVSGGADDLFGVDVSGGMDWDLGPDYSFGVDVSGGIDFGPDGLDYSFGVDVSGGVDDPFFGVDVSGGDQFGVDVSGGQEMDLEVAKAFGNTPANSVKACVIGTPNCAQGPGDPLHRVRISWKEPDVGAAATYSVYRVKGSTVSAASVKTLVGGADVAGSQLMVLDNAELPDAEAFTYYVIVHFTDGSSSGGSNFSTIMAINDAPVAENTTLTTKEDTASAPLTLAATDVDSAGPLVFSIVTGPSHGTLSGTLPNVIYTPHANYFGSDSFTFKANDLRLPWNDPGRDSEPATVDITVNPVNDAPIFTKGGDQTIAQGAGAQSVANWATGISPGPANSTPPAAPPASESGQLVNFIVTNSNNALFLEQPAISAAGTLTYRPTATGAGVATVTVRVHDNGGIAFGGVDTSAPQTFKITVVSTTKITAAGPADVWLGLKNSADVGTKFDVKAEVLKNDVVIATGQMNGVTLGSNSTTFNSSKAVLKAIGLAGTALPAGLAAGDVLSLRVSVRIAATGYTHTRSSATLWFNVTNPGEGNGHLHATVGGTSVKYYMAPSFVLKTSASVSGGAQSVDVVVDRAVNGNAFVSFGTWTFIVQ